MDELLNDPARFDVLVEVFVFIRLVANRLEDSLLLREFVDFRALFLTRGRNHLLDDVRIFRPRVFLLGFRSRDFSAPHVSGGISAAATRTPLRRSKPASFLR